MVYQTKHGLILHLLLVYFFWIVFRNHLLYKHPWLWTTTLLFQQVFIGEEIAESERNLVDAACASHTVRDTLRAAYITHTLWEWETPWKLPALHLESERNPESCLYTSQTPWEWETPWELLTSHTPCESERNPESCLYTSNTLRVRETMRAAYITPCESERHFVRAACITPCESERHFESCLHHTLWEWETPWELLTSQLVRVWEKPCDSCPVRHSVRVLPGGISCELWCSDTLWEIPCEIYTLRQFWRRIVNLFRVFHCGQGRFDRTENVKTAHETKHLFLETALLFSDLHNVWNLWASPCMRLIDTGVKIQNKHFETIYPWTCFLFVFSCQDLHFCCTQLGK